MTDKVVCSVEQLEKKDGQPNLLVFIIKHGENLLDDDDQSYATEVDADKIQEVDSHLNETSVVPDEDFLVLTQESNWALMRQRRILR